MNTRNRNLSVLMIAFVLACLCAAGPADVGQVATEDLSGCKLPHGIQELPEAGSPKAMQAKGYIFSVKQNRLAMDPLARRNERPASFKQFLDAVAADKTGDIFFESASKDLALIATSGRIQSLGSHYLHEFNGVEMSEPTVAKFTEEGETVLGILPKVSLGECFLLKTLDKDLVLLRLVSVDADRRACTIQWVKAAAGSRIFDIPKGALIEPKPEDAGRRVMQPRLSGKEQAQLVERWKKRDELTKKVDSHLVSRQSLIEYCMTVVTAFASDPNRVWLDPEAPIAVQTLGRLGAVQAAPLLVKIIDAPLSVQAIVSEVTIEGSFACVPALIALGKPGAAACVDSLTQMTPEEWERPLRGRLLVVVVLQVEGEKVTRFVLEEKKRGLKDEQQVKNIERAIALIDEAKSLSDTVTDPYGIEKAK